MTGATLLRDMATAMATAVNDRLWASAGVGRGGDDHYITQLNPDNTTRDFVDYDSNLIAIAHDIPDTARAAKVGNGTEEGSGVIVRGVRCNQRRQRARLTNQ